MPHNDGCFTKTEAFQKGRTGYFSLQHVSNTKEAEQGSGLSPIVFTDEQHCNCSKQIRGFSYTAGTEIMWLNALVCYEDPNLYFMIYLLTGPWTFVFHLEYKSTCHPWDLDFWVWRYYLAWRSRKATYWSPNTSITSEFVCPIFKCIWKHPIPN